MESSEPLNSISAFVNDLKNASKAEFVLLLRQLQVSPTELDSYAHFCEDNYVRHCFAQNEDWELLMLCWDKGQETPVHAHGGQECWVKVLQGEIEENLFSRDPDDESLTVTSCSIRQPGDISYMNDKIGLHTLGSPKGRSLTLHLYAKPIENCKIYDEDGALVAIKEMELDSTGV